MKSFFPFVLRCLLFSSVLTNGIAYAQSDIKKKKSPAARTESSQQKMYTYLTNHLFYLGTSESDYDIESRVYFNAADTVSKSGSRWGAIQVYIDGSSSYMTGKFEVSQTGIVSVHHLATHDPNSEQVHLMSGKLIKLSDSVFEIILKAPSVAEKRFYLFTL